MTLGLRLPEALARFGVQHELLPGWQARSAGSFSPRGSVSHWTAGPRGATTRPSLRVVRDGLPTIPGPLCNVYLDRYGVAVIVAAGRANHAGAGGWAGMTGNSSVFGTEAEGTIDDLTEAQLLAYPRVVAAYHWLTGADPASHAAGHHEWAPRRKIDIHPYMAQIRAEASRLWRSGGADPLPEADMATPNEILMAEMWHTHPDGSVEKHPFAGWITHMAQRSTATLERVTRLEKSTPTARFAFWRDKDGGLFEADVLAGTYRRTDADTVKARMSILDHYRVPYRDLTNAAPVTVPAAYGVEVK